MPDSLPPDPLETDETDEAARRGILRLYKRVCTEWTLDREQIKSFKEKIAHLEAHQRELAQQARELAAAGRYFSIDMDVALGEQAQQSSFEIMEETPASTPIQPAPEKALSVRMLILEIARQAYPQPVQANGIRLELLKRGIHTHEKTPGMTCYRWSLEDFMRRSGRDWYFVPEPERSVNGVNGHGKRWGPRSALVVQYAE